MKFDTDWCTYQPQRLGFINRKRRIDTALILHNRQHFWQANSTLFGHDGLLAHTIDPDNPTHEIEHILEGSFLTHCQPEEDITLNAEQWTSELQSKMHEEITLTINTKDFIYNFRSLKESKASSPSRHHIGHYIVAAKMENKTLKQIHCYIVVTALLTQTPLPRWEKCL